MGQKEGLPGHPYTHRAASRPCLLLEGQRPEQRKQEMTPKSSGVSPKFQSPTQSLPTRLMAQKGSLLDSPNRMAFLFPSSRQRESRVTSTHPVDSGRAPKQYLHPPPTPGCHARYLSSVSVETLSGALAVEKAISATLERDVLPTPTVVHFKVTEQGITLTDVQRK